MVRKRPNPWDLRLGGREQPDCDREASGGLAGGHLAEVALGRSTEHRGEFRHPLGRRAQRDPATVVPQPVNSVWRCPGENVAQRLPGIPGGSRARSRHANEEFIEPRMLHDGQLTNVSTAVDGHALTLFDDIPCSHSLALNGIGNRSRTEVDAFPSAPKSATTSISVPTCTMSFQEGESGACNVRAAKYRPVSKVSRNLPASPQRMCARSRAGTRRQYRTRPWRLGSGLCSNRTL
jgi:hypothetical protein